MTILPETAIDYPLLVEEQALGTGSCRVSLSLQYDEEQVVQYEGAVEVTSGQVEAVQYEAARQAPPEQAPARGVRIPLWMIAVLAVLGIIVGIAVGAMIATRKSPQEPAH